MADLRQEKPGFVAWTSSLAFFISCGVCGFANMPTGFETYTFCLMIVSRGAVYHTRKSAGEWKHFRRGCDCKVVPSFERDLDAELVEGVRPKGLRERMALMEKQTGVSFADKKASRKLSEFVALHD